MYLERDQEQFEEMGRLIVPQRGLIIGESELTRTTSVGHYQSEALTKPSYVALKENRDLNSYPDGIRDDSIKHHIALEIRFILAVEQRFPHLMPELPDFYGVLRGPNGFIGTLTEDFSEGGKHQVEDIPRYSFMEVEDAEVPVELRALLGETESAKSLGKMCFRVNGKRRIGDFGTTHRMAEVAEELERICPLDTVIEQMERVTLKLH